MIEVGSVQVVRPPGGLVDCSIDAPSAGYTVDGHVLRIAGWALGDLSPVQVVEVGAAGSSFLGRTGVDRPRPDMEAAEPTNPHAPTCGFDVAVSLLGLPVHFSLWVGVIDAAGVRHHIARVRGTRSTLDLGPGVGPHPLMVTTLGRTGSTWLTHFLGAHSEIMALEPFEVDVRVVSYWAEVCRALASPSGHLAPLFSTEKEGDLWWLGRQGTLREDHSIPGLEQWFATAHATAVAVFCRDRIQAFYRHAAATRSSGANLRFAVEKFNPTWVPSYVWELFPTAKEIFLVRDLRDFLASVIDFNRRRGYEAFGRSDFESDESYLRVKVRDDAESLLEAWRARRDRALLVRYEDLVLDPRPTAGAILEYLGLPADEASANSLVDQALLPGDRTASHRTTPDVATSVGRWRTDLDSTLQRACHEVLGEIMVEFGYDSEPASP